MKSLEVFLKAEYALIQMGLIAFELINRLLSELGPARTELTQFERLICVFQIILDF